MSVVISADLDDAKVAAGFKRMQASAASTGKSMETLGKTTATAGKVSAEGLGFVTGALGAINPQLALVGEQTVKQLPTLMAWGSSLARIGIIGGSMAAIADSAFKISRALSGVTKESITAESSLGKFIALGNSVKPGSFIDRLVSGTLNKLGVNRGDVEEQARDDKYTGSLKMDESKSGSKSGGLLYEMNRQATQKAKNQNYVAGVDNIQSKEKIIEQLAFEQKRIEGLRTLEALTESEAEASQAYTDALNARYETLDARIDDLNASAKSFSVERQGQWIDEIKTSKEALETVERLTNEYKSAYRNDKLTDDEKKQRLADLTRAQGQYTKTLADEKQQRKELAEAAKQEAKAVEEAREQKAKERQEEMKNRVSEILAMRGKEGGGFDAGAFDAGNQQVTAKMQRQAKAAASKAVRDQIEEINNSFAQEMEANANRVAGGGKDESRDIRRRRADDLRAAKQGRGDAEKDALVDLQRDVRDKVIDNAGRQMGLNSDQLEVNAEFQKQLDVAADKLESQQRLMQQFLGGARRRTQQAGRR